MKYEHLKRERMLHNDKTQMTPKPKNLRVVLRSMELTRCKPAPTPSVAGSVKHKPDDDVDLDVKECTLYRGIVGSLQYLSIHRCDVQFETNACAKEMKHPSKASWTRLKRLARYPAGTQSATVVLMKFGTDYDPHQIMIGVGMPRTGKVNRVRKLKLMSRVLCTTQIESTCALKWRS